MRALCARRRIPDKFQLRRTQPLKPACPFKGESLQSRSKGEEVDVRFASPFFFGCKFLHSLLAAARCFTYPVISGLQRPRVRAISASCRGVPLQGDRTPANGQGVSDAQQSAWLTPRPGPAKRLSAFSERFECASSGTRCLQKRLYFPVTEDSRSRISFTGLSICNSIAQGTFIPY